MDQRANRKNSRPLRVIAIHRQLPAGLLWAFAVFAAAVFLAAPARGANLSSTLKAKLDKCKSDFHTAFQASFNASEQWKETAERCALNRTLDNRKAKNNFKFLVHPPVLQRNASRIQSSHSEVASLPSDAHDGICERTYEAAVWTLESMEKAREGICKRTMQEVNSMADCYEDAKFKKCEQELVKIKRAIEADHNNTLSMINEFGAFLGDNAKNVDNAKKKYDDDLIQLKSTARVGVAMNIGDNGGAADNDAYLRLLLKNPEATNLRIDRNRSLQSTDEYGDIVQEQINAGRAISTLAEDMKKYQLAQNKFHDEFKDTVGTYKETDTTDLTKYAGLAAPAATAVSGLSGAGAAASALPLAAAAAGGAATLASAGRSSTGGGFDGVAGATGPAIAQTGTSTTGSGPQGAGAIPAPGSLIPVTELITKTETKEEKGRAPSSDTFIPPGKLAASGSSTSMGKNGVPAPAQNGATTAPAGSTDDLLHSFNDAIKPVPAPTKKKDDGLGDMSSIFGQVSKMFNLDAPPAGEAPPPADTATADSSGGGEFNDGFQYGGSGGGNYAAATTDDASGPVNAENASPEEREMMQFGSIGTPLFQRVHARHRLCMEKGLLLQEFGRLPQ